MDDDISIYSFCRSLDSRLRMLLRLVKFLFEYGLSGLAAGESVGTVGLAGHGLGMDLMVLFIFCDFF
jgi:hypothetical protein